MIAKLMIKGSARLRIYSILLGMFILAGCEVTDVPEGGPVNVKFWAEKDRYEMGSSIKTMLKNGAEIPISYNLCFSRLVHKIDGEWEEVGTPPLCTSEVNNLAPGDSTSYNIMLDSDTQLPEGLYKVKTSITIEEEKTVTTQPFEIQTESEAE